MVATIHSVTFSGLQAQTIEVQAQLSPGLPGFSIVGLPDKAVSEARERVRGALQSMGLALPPKRVTVNLAPADVTKEGSHFDLPIALAVLAAMQVIPMDAITSCLAMGELSLNGQIRSVSGILPATMHAHDRGLTMICPQDCGREAAWIDAAAILAPPNLLALINHFKGTQILSAPVPPDPLSGNPLFADFADVKGQNMAKRALEIAAAGGHNVLMCGPPGSGKSMLASRVPSILPNLSPMEALEALRQPLETGQAVIARANHHVSYPARFQLIAAMNPCRCGNANDNSNPNSCARGPKCASDYQSRLSGPLLDRFDIFVDVPAVLIEELQTLPMGEKSAHIAARVSQARNRQQTRHQNDFGSPLINSQLQGEALEQATRLDNDGTALMKRAAQTLQLSARGYYRVLRVARTIADLADSETIQTPHLAEALAFRRRNNS